MSFHNLVDERPRVEDRSERVEVAEQGCCIVKDEPYFIDDLLIGIDVPITSNHVVSICVATLQVINFMLDSRKVIGAFACGC